MHALDNPIWHALATGHSGFAKGDELAKRYPNDVSPLAAMREPSMEAYRSLSRVLQPQGVAALFLDSPVAPPSGWTVVHTQMIAQMVCDRVEPRAMHEPMPELTELTAADVPEMLHLVELTKPGPFRDRTRELGTYLGIRRAGTLVAMTGERLRLDGYTEVSAVCTHPDHRGHGYASVLIAEIMRRQAEHGVTPFLHVRADNDSAIRVYEKLGFTTRRLLHMAVLRTPPHAEFPPERYAAERSGV